MSTRAHKTKLYAIFLLGIIAVFACLAPLAFAQSGPVPPPSAEEQAKSGESYVPGTGSITNHALTPEDVENTNPIIVPNNKVTQFKTRVILASDKPANSIWLGYRLTVPQYTKSHGELSITAGFVKDLATGKKTVSAKPDGKGNLVIEGRFLDKNTDGYVIPGDFSSKVSLMVKDAVQGDAFDITEEYWIWADGEQKTQSTVVDHIEVGPTKPEYQLDTINYNGSNQLTPIVYGYYNSKTHEFSSIPKSGNDWKEGLILSVFSGVQPLASSEKIDPSKPITWNLSAKTTTADGSSNSALDAQLIGIMPWAQDDWTSAYPSKFDLSLNNSQLKKNIHVPNGYFNNQTRQFISQGDDPSKAYSFSGNAENLHINALLSNDKLAPWRGALVYAEYFVPISDSDTAKNQRTVTIEGSNLSLTSFTGKVVGATKTSEKMSVKIPFDIKGTANFTRRNFVSENPGSIAYGGEIHSLYVGDSQDMWYELFVSSTGPSVSGLNIRAYNILTKFSDGFTKQRDFESTGYVDAEGNTLQPNIIWGVKPDGKPWSDVVEMSHTEDYMLRYYDSFEEAQKHGCVVARLDQFRGGIQELGNLYTRNKYTLEGKALVPQIAVVDYRIWEGNSAPGTSDVWNSTNGTALQENTFNGKVIPSSVLKTPYDNPSLTEPEDINKRSYMPWTWPAGAKEPIPYWPVTNYKRQTYGDTIFPITAKVSIIQSPRITVDGKSQYGSTNLNGSDMRYLTIPEHGDRSRSTFDLSEGNRIIDRIVSIQVAGEISQPIHAKLDLDLPGTRWAPRPPIKTGESIKQFGEVILSTKENPVTYIPNEDPQQPGTFVGGTVVDPNDVVFTSPGIYSFYFRSSIGEKSQPFEPADGVYLNAADMSLLDGSQRLASIETHNLHQSVVYTAEMVRKSNTGIMQSNYTPIINPFANENNIPSWTTTIYSKDTMNNLYGMDILPYNNDENGTKILNDKPLLNGSVTLSQGLNPATSSAKPTASFRLFYTTDMSVQNGHKPEEFAGMVPSALASVFEHKGVTWHEAALQPDQTYKIDQKSTAIIWATDSMPQKEWVSASIGLNYFSAQGDKLTNVASYSHDFARNTSIVSNKASVVIPEKNISGIAYEDVNQNGIYDAGDKPISDVVVTLESASAKRAKRSASQELATAVTNQDGKYTISNVPDSPNGYFVTFKGDNIDTLCVTTMSSTPVGSVEGASYVAKNTTSGEVSTPVFSLASISNLFARQESSASLNNVNAGFIPANPVEIQLTGTKELHGNKLIDGQFIFNLKNVDTASEQNFAFEGDTQFTKKEIEKSNDSKGVINFGKITFRAPGTYRFKASEQQSNVPGYTYDTSEFDVTVVVTKDPKDCKKLVAKTTIHKADQEASSITFTNSYSAKANTIITAKKVLNNAELAPGQFEFILTNQNGTVISKASCDQNGNVIFPAIEFTKDAKKDDTTSDHIFYINEINNGQTGITYDTHKEKIVVKVVDNGKGELTASQTSSEEPTFTNTYSATGTVALTALKRVEGTTLKAGQFKFELSPVDGAPGKKQVVANDESGSIRFAPISYSIQDLKDAEPNQDGLREKTFTYHITEVNEHKEGYTYDPKVATVKVVVRDNQDGTLSALPEYDDATFTNSYAANTKLTINATKELHAFKEGKEVNEPEIQDDQFSFILLNEEGEQIAKTTNKGSEISFDLEYNKNKDKDETGIHTYTLVEEQGEQRGMTYDTEPRKITVEVTDKDNGQLDAKIVDGKNPVITNVYKPLSVKTQIKGLKKLEGRDLKAGEFTFELKDEQGNILATSVNEADGSIIFDDVDISIVGTTKLYMREVKGTDSFVTYDEHEAVVEVQAIDDDGQITIEHVIADGKEEPAQFINQYVAPPTPQKPVSNKKKTVGILAQTSDPSITIPMVGLFGLIVVGASIVLHKREF